MDVALILATEAPAIIDEGFCDAGLGCWAPYAFVGLGLAALGYVLVRTRRRSEEAYWQRRRLEAERRANDPDMAKPRPDEQL